MMTFSFVNEIAHFVGAHGGAKPPVDAPSVLQNHTHHRLHDHQSNPIGLCIGVFVLRNGLYLLRSWDLPLATCFYDCSGSLPYPRRINTDHFHAVAFSRASRCICAISAVPAGLPAVQKCQFSGCLPPIRLPFQREYCTNCNNCNI